jgi:uncharacterized protein YebE (UPF0316 family)
MEELFASAFGPLLLFGLRIIDVSMSIMRTIVAVRGRRALAAFIGFFEVMLWLLIVGNALKNMHSVFHVIGYAGGFAAGNYVGVWVEGRFAIGLALVRAVCRNDLENGHRRGIEIASSLREKGYAVTELLGRGRNGEVDILNLVAKRRRVPDIVKTIEAGDPAAFVTIEEVRGTKGGYFLETNRFWFPGGRKAPFMP